MSVSIEQMIDEDLHLFLSHLERKNKMNVESVVELASYISANMMRLIYTKQKSISKDEINGVIGTMSNCLYSIFKDNITQEDYKKIATTALSLLKNTAFDEQSQLYFRSLVV